MATHLTEHFTLEEFTFSQTACRMGIDNTPGETELANIQLTAEVMEDVRLILGSKPILITSGYRSPAVNAACGGSSTSAHMSGLACDFHCPEFGTPLDICKELEPQMALLSIDQLIHEYSDWVHLAICIYPAEPRCECLTIDNSGTTTGFG